MKRTERHRLKQNELATSVAHARESVTENRRAVAIALAGVVAVLIGGGGYLAWRANMNNKAGELLAGAMTVAAAPVTPPQPADAATPPAPPAPGSYPNERAKLEAALTKFMAAADAYPSTKAGLAARYHAAGTLATLGRTAEAEQRYREVIDRDRGIYAEMSRLGLAETQSRAGRHDDAIRTWKELSDRADAQLPLDGVLMRLARSYEAAGKPADARQTFKRIVDEFPQSPYAADAKQQLDALPATAPPKS
jgi:TolA-binding protein